MLCGGTGFEAFALSLGAPNVTSLPVDAVANVLLQHVVAVHGPSGVEEEAEG